MSCIRTGAVVFFNNYGFNVPADIYEIDSAYIIRWNPKGKDFAATALDDATHEVMHWSDNRVWHREDIGVTVIPKSHLRFYETLHEQG